MHLVGLDWLRIHLQVPDLKREIISGQQVATRVAELHIGDAGNDLREETSVGRVFGLLKYCIRQNSPKKHIQMRDADADGTMDN